MVMKYTFTLLVMLILPLFNSCTSDPNKEIDEGHVEGNIYTSNEVGWTMEIPEGWEVMTKKESIEHTEKGAKAIGEVYDGEFDTDGLKDLIGFKKNPYNAFTSTSQLFEEEYPDQWHEINNELKELLYNTFVNQGIKVDTFSSSKIIDGQHFAVFTSALYTTDGTLVLTQDLYSCLRNGYDFGVSLNYNNPIDKETLEKVWFNSKFTN